jgi:hypothetical protein
MIQLLIIIFVQELLFVICLIAAKYYSRLIKCPGYVRFFFDKEAKERRKLKGKTIMISCVNFNDKIDIIIY